MKPRIALVGYLETAVTALVLSVITLVLQFMGFLLMSFCLEDSSTGNRIILSDIGWCVASILVPFAIRRLMLHIEPSRIVRVFICALGLLACVVTALLWGQVLLGPLPILAHQDGTGLAGLVLFSGATFALPIVDAIACAQSLRKPLRVHESRP